MTGTWSAIVVPSFSKAFLCKNQLENRHIAEAQAVDASRDALILSVLSLMAGQIGWWRDVLVGLRAQVNSDE